MFSEVETAQSRKVSFSGHARLTRLRHHIVMTAVLCLLVGGLLRIVDGHIIRFQTPIATAATPLVPVISAPDSQASTSAGASTQLPQQSSSANTKVPAVPKCTADAYNGPAAIDLSNAASGLTQLVDPIHYYQVYGYNAATIRQQILACAPRSGDADDFTGYTMYRLNWQYNHGPDGSGLCRVQTVKIGLHIGEVLPAWQASSFATPGLATSWQSFSNSLHAHEQGHQALDQQYATDLLNKLQNLPASDCSTIAGTINQTIQTNVDALNQANDTYDDQTNHGATQGAILP